MSEGNKSNKKELAATFTPADIEAPLYQKWLLAGYFTADAKSTKPPFTIVIPPPNVTGSLHIGHALDHTLQDVLIRLKRMKGFEALWLPGMDHAGIATQNVVEKQLAVDGLSRHDLGREAFVAKVWEWKEESGGLILDQMKRLGDSVDWSRERFTMDAGLSKAVLEIFKRLYDAELIYRAERIINWCPRCLTALSDIEVEHSDDSGEFIQVRYGDDDVSIVVATTRAETMMGDGAVAVHPDDPRYKDLIGKLVLLPLVNRMIPIIADELVDSDFGTGAVKVTGAHDPNDFEMAMRHNIEMPIIMNEHGVMANSGTRFDGMDRFEARKEVVEELRKLGRIVSEKRPYVHAVGHCQRCDTTVEPRLSKQWFVKVAPLAKAAGDAVRDGRIKIEPEELAPRYFEWIDNMHDWCISRQLWWGHQIPVYYGPNGEVVVCGPDEVPPAGYIQDPDVLDTWFSSGLWPFSTLGWPDKTDDLAKFFPTSVLVTGYDILFFWVARMVLLGLFVTDGVAPFHTIALHGLVRDRFGKKMSKSRGNTVDPIEFMDKYGSDALRFTLARGANPGTDQAIAEEWIGGSRNFATKLWNASRFAIINGANVEGELPEFATGGDEAANSKRVLGHVLDQLLRLMHPMMPFITEELWCSFTGGETLVTAAWPKSNTDNRSEASKTIVAQLQDLITEIRRFRNDQGIKTSAKIGANFIGLDSLSKYEAAIRFVCRIESITGSASAAIEVGKVKVEFDLTGAIDVVAERARLTKDLATAEKDRATAKIKLENDGFMAKAPIEVVQEIRERLAQTSADIESITAQLSALPTK
jgi:valyl-tRNA synthetase